MRTDRQRINWLEKEGFGCAIVSDDNGHWAVAWAGFHNVAAGKRAVDIHTTFFIEKKKWQKSVRAAIDKAMGR